MKHELKRIKNSASAVGEIILDAEVGKKDLYSSRQAEIAMSTGDFEYIKEIPESDAEQRLVEIQAEEIEERRAELKAYKVEELQTMFPDLELKGKKEEIIETIISAPATAPKENE